MMRTALVALLVFSGSSVAAQTTGEAQTDEGSASSQSAPLSDDPYPATLAALSQSCLTYEGEETGIIDSLVPTLVGSSLDLIKGLIRSAAEARTTPPVVGIATGDLSTATLPRCLFLARGDFSPNPGTGNDDRSLHLDQSQREILSASGINIVGAPDFFFEGRLEWAQSSGAVRVQPLTVYLGESQIDGGGDRTITMTFTLKGPNNHASSSSIVIPEMSTNSLRSYNWDVPLSGGWINAPLSESATPFQLEANYAEFRRANEAARFLLRAYEAVEQPLTQRLNRALLPSLGWTAELTSQRATATAVQAAYQQFASACSAVQEFQGASGTRALTALGAAVQAQAEANAKASEAGLGVFFAGNALFSPVTSNLLSVNRARATAALTICEG